MVKLRLNFKKKNLVNLRAARVKEAIGTRLSFT